MTVQGASVVPIRGLTPRPARAEGPTLVLRIARSASVVPAVSVVHVATRQCMAEWRGEVARQLLVSPAFRHLVDGDGDYPCSQACVHQILLGAAAIEAGLEGLHWRRDTALAPAANHSEVTAGFAPEPLRKRLARARIMLDGDTQFVARLLFDHPGEHFTARDVVCLATLVSPALKPIDVEEALAELAGVGVIQRIAIDNGPVFYDIDTRPHAHHYDPSSGQLRDLG
ncbi:MAG: hypothetical protein AAF545_15170 [Pseudomonadota bacterium]